MTTPAQNVNSSLTGPAQQVWYDQYGNVTNTLTSTQLWRHRVLRRPASVSNPANPKTGWRAPSAYFNYGYDVRPCPIGTLTAYRSTGGRLEFRDGARWTNSGDEQVVYDSSLEDRAIGSALNKLKNSKVNLAVAFAERAETAELVTDAIHGISNLTRAFRKKDPKLFLRGRLGGEQRGRHRQQTLPDSFLAWQYGVEPLVQDVYGACDALREKDNERPYIITVTSSARANKDSVWIKRHDVYGSAAFRVSRTERHRFFVRLDYYVDNPLLVSLSAVGITNPALLAWERLPFSFVVDWFLPIGNWLGYLDAQLGYKFKSGSWSAICRRTETGSFVQDGNLPSGIVGFSYSGEPYTYAGHYFQRGLYGAVPLPSIGFKNPFPKNGVHIANAIALLAGLFR